MLKKVTNKPTTNKEIGYMGKKLKSWLTEIKKWKSEI